MYSIDYTDLGTPGVEADKTVTLEIDGVAVTVPEGTSIMRAAALVQRDIPKLCATDSVKAFEPMRRGGCSAGAAALSPMASPTWPAAAAATPPGCSGSWRRCRC